MAVAPMRTAHPQQDHDAQTDLQPSGRTTPATRNRLRVALGLTVLILLVEVAGGLVAHSLALISDAGHVLTDVIALGLAWFAMRQAERPSNDRKTFGYHRTEILAALANSATLLAIVVGIAVEAVRRFSHPVAVTPWVLFVAAGVGIAINLIVARGLHGARGASGQNLNIRAALLHVLGDIGASVGVVVAGVVMLLTHWYLADPLLSLAIALLIARGAWGILRETLDILMEATPRGLDVGALVRDLAGQPGVSGVHDLHVWTITGGVCALSAHVTVGNRRLSDCDPLLDRLNQVLRERYQIAHATLQLECATCASPDLYCTLSPGEGEGTTHSHPHTHLHAHSHAHGSHQQPGPSHAEPAGEPSPHA